MSSCPATLKPRANSNHSWSRTLVIGLSKCVYSFSLTLRFSLEPFNDVWQCGPGTITCNCNHTVCVTCYFIGSVTSRLRRRRGALPPPRPAPRAPPPHSLTSPLFIFIYLPFIQPGPPFRPFLPPSRCTPIQILWKGLRFDWIYCATIDFVAMTAARAHSV